MNKNKHKDNYISVLKALKHADIQYSWDGYTRLYITRENGLDLIDIHEIKNVLLSLESEGVFKIFQDIKLSDYYQKSTPLASIPEFPGSKKRIILQNHFILIINKSKFNNLLRSSNSPFHLLSIINSGKKTKNQKIIAALLIEKGKVPTRIIATKIKLKVNSEMRDKVKLTDEKYSSNAEKTKYYNEQIENCIKTLRSKIKPYGYTIKFNKNDVELINLNL